MFRSLSVVPGESFDVVMAGHLGKLPAGRARLVLDQLRELQLIQETKDPDFFTMHSLLREFARELLSGTEAAKQVTRALTFSCTLAKKADLVIRSLAPVRDMEQPEDHPDFIAGTRSSSGVDGKATQESRGYSRASLRGQEG